MASSIRLAGALLALPLCAAGQAPGTLEKATTEARATATALTDSLRKLLGAELAAGGFAGAVAACSRSAQQATAALARERGVAVRRVSIQFRNAADEPDTWERARLREFTRLHAAGKLPEEHSAVVVEQGRRVLRYLKPITIQALCLNCHGGAGQIPAEVSKVLAERYPNDRATGYRAGDLRGAISVRIPLAE